jgi:penicillin amidase
LLAVVVAALLGLPLAAAAGIYALGHATVAPLSGALPIPSLAAPVDIIRDQEGVPHILGATLEDLYTGLGMAHAQDRLWQMELMRRAAQGRLSEIFGERTINTDIFMRTLDLYGHAERALAALSNSDRAALAAYARGVNAWIERPTSLVDPKWPPEFLLLRYRPEAWRPADSLAILKIMALNLSTNMGHEITRLAFAARGFGPEEIEDLLPTQGAKAPPLPDIRTLYPLEPPTRHAAANAGLESIGEGASNNWVVAGSRTRSGAPLLANDPHLRLAAPSTWYFAHLALTEPGRAASNVAGASLPGLPLIVLGHGDSVAWGFTNTGADVQDIFIEKLNPDRPDEYLTPDGWRRFEAETIDIRVKDAPSVTVERRRTRHGPVLPGSYRGIDAMLAPGHVAALQWTALDDDDTTIAAGLFDPRLRTVDGYMQRMQAYVVPAQNMVVADSDGNIGFIAPGRIPVRDPANLVAGRAPVPGWEAKYDWKGYIPFNELPHVVNPPAGAIGTANASIVGPDYPYMIALDWDVPYRQQRIDQLIIARSDHDMASMKAAQLDVLSLAYVRLKPLMIAAARAAPGADPAMLDRLQAWDATMRADAVEPLIFMAWLRETVRAIWQDDLGPTFGGFFAPRAYSLIRLLEGRASGRDWCDDLATTPRESCGQVIARALDRALAGLARRYGSDRKHWSWGDAHFADNEHRPFGEVPILASLFNVQVPSPGDTYTLNRGQVDFGSEPPFANRGAATCRAIYDFSDLDGSLFIHTTGQSGNPFSPFYRSLAERWSKGDYIRIPIKRPEIERLAIGTWRLKRR